MTEDRWTHLKICMPDEGDPLPTPMATDCDVVVKFTQWSHATTIFAGHDRTADRWWVMGGTGLKGAVNGEGRPVSRIGAVPRLAQPAFVHPADLPAVSWWALLPKYLPSARE